MPKLTHKQRFSLIAFPFAVALITSCDSKKVEYEAPALSPSSEKEKMATHLSDPGPTRVPFPKELEPLLDQMMKSVIRVVSKQNTLEQEESFLGKGRNYAEKHTPMLLMRSYDKELAGERSGIVFKRLSDKLVWSHGYFYVTAPGDPRVIYDMKLPASFFSGLTFNSAYALNRLQYQPPVVNFFEFKLTQNGIPVLLKFEAPIEVSNLEDKYPKSFIRLDITRVE